MTSPSASMSIRVNEAESSRTAAKDNSLLMAERWLFWYLVLAPVWWMFGILTVLGVVGLAILFFLRPPRDPAIRMIVVLWFAVAAAQAVAVIVNWGFLREASWLSLPYRLLNTGVTGWMLLGMAIGVGAEYRLSSPRVIRGLCIFSLWLLILGIGSYATAFAFNLDSFWVRSPIGLLLPERLPAIRNFFALNFFFSEPIFGVDAVRLILFFPWMNVLALAGITIILACAEDRSHLWRFLGVSAGIFALAASFSRSAVLSLFVVLALMAWWRAHGGTKFVTVALIAVAVNVMALLGITPDQAIALAYDEFNAARSGSSSARALANQMSWEGFLASPVVGQGWVGPIYSPEIPIPAGSHSTFYGLLYTGGVLTLTAFLVAFLGTFGLAAARATRNRQALAALGMIVVLGIFSYAECLYSLVPAWLAGFIWIGARLAREPEAAFTHEGITHPPWRHHAPETAKS
jgi:hypothetical protein